MDPHILIMERCSDLRRRGREGLSGKWMEAVLTVLVFSVLIQIPVAVINSVFGASPTEIMQNLYGTSYGSMAASDFPDEKVSSLSYLYLLLVSGPLTYGITLFFMRLFRGTETEIATVMSGFEKFLKTFGLSLYMAIFVFLWSLLFIVPGIIAAIRYSQAYYILADDPMKPITQCVNESKALMAGNKGKLFALNLSFIGWYLLAMIPVGIVTYFVSSLGSYFTIQICAFISGAGAFWVEAYLMTANVAFHDILTGRINGDTYRAGEY